MALVRVLLRRIDKHVAYGYLSYLQKYLETAINTYIHSYTESLIPPSTSLSPSRPRARTTLHAAITYFPPSSDPANAIISRNCTPPGYATLFPASNHTIIQLYQRTLAMQKVM